MPQRLVIEAVMVAIYGQLLVPDKPVEYIIPYSTILELYDLQNSQEPMMPNSEDEAHVRNKINEFIRFFEDPLNQKKIERCLSVPWKKSSPILLNEKVTVIVINGVDNARYGEWFDPIETEMVLTALHEQIAILTDQFEFVDKVIEAEIPAQVFDIDDFEFALEEETKP